MNLSEITPVAQDYLKAIWSATEWGDPPITTTALAARLGTTSPNVTDTIKRLAAQGLVEYRPYKPVTLTETGRAYAIAMVRRHRLLESFLVTTLGYSWEQVHAEAERLEHAASDQLIERIDTVLGRPDHDPHGDPIPAADGHTHRPAHALRLDDAPPGAYEITRISDADPQRLARFHDQGVTPGTALGLAERTADGAATIALTPRHRITLAPDDAAAIWVLPR